MSDAYASLLSRFDSYDGETEEQDRAALLGYAMALYDYEHITLDEIEDFRQRLGLTAEDVDQILV